MSYLKRTLWEDPQKAISFLSSKNFKVFSTFSKESEKDLDVFYQSARLASAISHDLLKPCGSSSVIYKSRLLKYINLRRNPRIPTPPSINHQIALIHNPNLGDYERFLFIADIKSRSAASEYPDPEIITLKKTLLKFYFGDSSLRQILSKPPQTFRQKTPLIEPVVLTFYSGLLDLYSWEECLFIIQDVLTRNSILINSADYSRGVFNDVTNLYHILPANCQYLESSEDSKYLLRLLFISVNYTAGSFAKIVFTARYTNWEE